MPLTNLAIQNARPRETPYKLSDGGGLFLLVNPNSTRLWRLAYRHAGRQKTLAIGSLKDIGVTEARARATEARALLREGLDPSAEKRKARQIARVVADNTFAAMVESYRIKREKDGVGPTALRKDKECLAWALRDFGHRPVSAIEPLEVLATVRKIEAQDKSAKRFRATVSRVFRFAIASGLAGSDPAAPLTDALVTKTVVHHPSPKEPRKVGALVRSVDGYEGQPLTRLALLIGIHTFVRPTELRHAEWSEIDLAGAIWRISGAKMKMKHDLVVPLSKQVLGYFGECAAVSGGGRWVFPSTLGGSRVMSDNTVNAALRRLGYTRHEVVGHGFRSMASTTLNESGLFQPDWIERQLAHVDDSRVRSIYNAALYLDHRKHMMQWYSDWLDKQASSA